LKLLSAILVTFLLMGYSGAALAESDAPFALQDFVTVPHGLASAIVTDSSGQAIGIVSAISINRSGRPVAIAVLLASGRRITIAASSASYDPIANRVIAVAPDIRLAAAR
jgi:hypothetical protein